MAKNRKKAKRKNKKVSPSYLKYIIGIAISLLSLLAIFRAGIIGKYVFEIFDFLTGELYIILCIYLIIMSYFLMFKSLKIFLISKKGLAFNLSMIIIILSSSIFYFYSFVPALKINDFKYILDTIGVSHGTGILGFYTYTTIFNLGGFIGLIITMLGLVIALVFLLVDINALKEKRLEKKKAKEMQIEFDAKIEEDLKTKKNEKIANELEVGTGVTMFNMENDSNDKVQTETIKLKNENKNLNFYEDGVTEYHRTMAFSKEEIDEIQELAKKERDLEDVEDNHFLGSEVPIFMQTEDEKSDHYNIEKKTRIDDLEYTIPSTELLKDYGNNSSSLKFLEKVAIEKGDLLVSTLASFNLRVKLLNIHIGPNVTKYELQPEAGVKVSKFSSLSNDIALSLAASNVRIEAPIPGKAAVGIEIPNEKTMMVSLREVLEAKNNKFDSKLQIGLGKDISGSSIFTEIDKTPHLLVAGATGSGKSVCINSIIISILMKATPKEVKMVMIDPKKVELAPYNGIPHLLTPVVTEPKKAAIILQKMVAEMENRYELFAETNTRNIQGFNEKVEKSKSSYSKLPYIVIIVDELADLMMIASNEVETSIARLAQMARAAGMHLIIATQRPSTDVITGLIKANIPSRIAFSVSSSIDSRTILDSSGAEKLLGRGDMLLSEQSSPILKRIQGAFLSDDEVYKVVKFITNQFPKETIESNYDENLTNISEDSFDEELDELYDEVKADVVKMQKASASFIQRKYRVGYNRALRIMDQLEMNGIISANEGPKPRRVLIGGLDEDC
ncbi:MAG: DNA translocase FtsK [Mycoplasmatales bacterium]